jgi:lipopolysaccharide assembly outer membrane protein LptD (OstA)
VRNSLAVLLFLAVAVPASAQTPDKRAVNWTWTAVGAAKQPDGTVRTGRVMLDFHDIVLTADEATFTRASEPELELRGNVRMIPSSSQTANTNRATSLKMSATGVDTGQVNGFVRLTAFSFVFQNIVVTADEADLNSVNQTLDLRGNVRLKASEK